MKLLASIVVIAAVALAPQTAGAVAIGQIDTFEDGTTEGWFAGGGPFGAMPPNPPQVVDTGGPGGAGDAFLQITAVGGSGGPAPQPGSRLSANNTLQWAGDYLTAGVTGIAMDLRNLGTSDLTIRLLFEDPIPGPPVNVAVTSGALLPAGGDWTRVVFPVSAADLTALSGDPTVLLSQVTFVRIVHSPTPGLPIPQVSGVLGVDNISAIPEPSSLALVASAALAGLTAYRRRRSFSREGSGS
ncbi:MAG: PEP-CTERM sorting domain-containing protein [Alphaproteobacteria bacterium]